MADVELEKTTIDSFEQISSLESSTNLLIRYLLKYLQQSRTTLTNVQVLNLIQRFCKGEIFYNKK
jgi:hypothetical protein